MTAVPAYDLDPTASVMLVGLLVAAGPLLWVWRRHRTQDGATRLGALTWATLFLTFDLVLFGAFTRLTDSGLGCPDWPGCYGNASPLGAQAHIQSAQAAMPNGPVTHGKAWIEMVHRYLATGVGALIVVLASASWVERLRARREHGKAWTSVRGLREPVSPWWPTLTLAWVIAQGAFGALTVTMKLYPAIVTAHLLGGIGLLALLAAQTQAHARAALRLPDGLHAAALAVAVLTVAQVALGGWVSTNYAVLACTEFPTCQGTWWPPMDFEHGFAIFRELGAGKDGGYIPFAALTAIHYVHRLAAYVLVAALALLAWGLWQLGEKATRRWALALAGVAAWQVGSGLANVLFGWPLGAAVAHTGGASMLVVLLTVLIVRSAQARRRTVHAGAMPEPARAAS
jgi:cytochrome c oxidase assembly protein subunit 15